MNRIHQTVKEMKADIDAARSLLTLHSDYEGAIVIYTRLIQAWSGKAKFPLMRARLYARIGKVVAAIRDVSKAIRLNPGHIETHRYRAQLLLQEGRNAEALKDASRMVRLTTGLMKARNHCFRADVLLRLGERGKALVEMDRAVLLQPRDSDLWRFRAGVRETRWDLKGATMDYSMAIRTGPATPWDYYDRGRVNELRGNVLAAIEDYRRAAHLAPGWDGFSRCFYRLRARVLRGLDAAS